MSSLRLFPNEREKYEKVNQETDLIRSPKVREVDEMHIAEFLEITASFRLFSVCRYFHGL